MPSVFVRVSHGSVIAIKGAPGVGESFIIVEFPHMACKENISISLFKKKYKFTLRVEIAINQ